MKTIKLVCFVIALFGLTFNGSVWARGGHYHGHHRNHIGGLVLGLALGSALRYGLGYGGYSGGNNCSFKDQFLATLPRNLEG